MRQTLTLTSAVVAALLGLSAATLAAAPAAPPPSVDQPAVRVQGRPAGDRRGAAAAGLAAPVGGARRRAVRLPGAGHARREDAVGHGQGRLRPPRSRSPTAAPRSSPRGATAGACACGTAAGKASAWSAPASWEMGLLKPGRLDGPLDPGGRRRAGEGVAARADAARHLRGEGRRAVGARVRHEPGPVRAGAQRQARGRPALHARLDELQQAPAVPDLRRHRPPARRATTRSARCSATAGTAATSPGRTGATSTATAWRCSASCGSSTRTAASTIVGTDGTWKSTTGPIRSVGHLQRRDLRRPAGAARLERAGLRRRGLGARARASSRAKRVARRAGGPAGPARSRSSGR